MKKLELLELFGSVMIGNVDGNGFHLKSQINLKIKTFDVLFIQ